MSNSPRDTQFKNFAKLLLDELCLASDVHIETPFNDDWREEWEETIAQRAYDLVDIAICHVAMGMSNDSAVMFVPRQDAVKFIPDMTELPQED